MQIRRCIKKINWSYFWRFPRNVRRVPWPLPLRFLYAVFGLCLVLRFLYVTVHLGPFHDISNDWGRHWWNGVHLFDAPEFMGGVDPKLFQLWVWLLHTLTGDRKWAVEGVTGLLCAAMPYVWFLVAREIFTLRQALVIAIVIAVSPTFLVIYSFFMNETLLLVMLGLALWLTLRAVRLRTPRAYQLAVVFWVLALHARMTVLPLMLLSIGWMLGYQMRKLRSLCFAVMALVVLTLPAAVQSYRVLGTFSPFQFSTLNAIYFKNGSMFHNYYIIDGRYRGSYSWSSPSYYMNVLEPLAEFRSYRNRERAPVIIRMENGSGDFDREYATLRSEYDLYSFLNDTYENMLFLFVSGSWPDSGSWSDDWFFRMNFYMRWMWTALMVGMVVLGPFVPLGEKKAFLMALTLALIFTLSAQQLGIMEGRYRKPLEPLLLMSAVAVWPGLRVRQLAPGLYTPYHFGLQYYLLPMWRKGRLALAALG